jgi:tellurite resistance protein TerC
VKLVLHALHESGVHVPEIGIPFSLSFIVLVLAVTTFTSLRASRKQAAEETEEAQDADRPAAESS